ncbi:biotin/lipoyl-binding protein [Alkalinema sp. FACHB-956]|uniref:HlyD family efflux transporter periplasmic adaptor subunit n=1 Tax=Alkalinema sp. FACHB-956 TaxID=2692768 RepID=UPI0016883D61|nr:biotin/lipoyl-binding protein [Alkalinema sp. FACHB-956]MBD2330012.1 biotin/lipoyl-binding protein [Alkalinema sp. FACHB-956]
MIAFKEWPEKIFNSKPLIVTGVAALAIGVLGTRFVLQTPPPTETSTSAAAQTAPEIRSVSALGKLEPAGTIVSVFANGGSEGVRVEALRVQEGDRVKKGDVIAILSNEKRLQSALQQAQEQVRVAQARLAQVKSGAKSGEIAAQRSEIARLEAQRTGDLNTQAAVVARLEAERTGDLNAQNAVVARLEAEVANAKVEFERYDNLFTVGGISASSRDSKHLAWQTAQKQLQESRAALERTRESRTQQINEAKAALARTQTAQAEQIAAADSTLDRIAEVRPVDVQAAQAEVAQAQAAVTKAQADLEQAYVIAPQDGVILKIYTYAGERIGTEGVVDIGRTQQMTALVEVYESDVKRLEVGQSATVTSEAIEGELTGKVSEIGRKVLRQNVINTDPSANTDSRVIEVRITLDDRSTAKAEKFTNSQVTAKIALN